MDREQFEKLYKQGEDATDSALRKMLDSNYTLAAIIVLLLAFAAGVWWFAK